MIFHILDSVAMSVLWLGSYLMVELSLLVNAIYDSLACFLQSLDSLCNLWSAINLSIKAFT